MVSASLPESFTPSYLRQLELLRLRARRAFLGSRQGGHLSLKKGHGIEFSDYRKYELGDNPRHIDWGLYGRSERLYVKRFQEEQDIGVVLLLDGTASMRVPESGIKWLRAKELALSLAYVGFMQRDTVRLVCPGGYYGSRVTSPSALYRLADDLEQLPPIQPQAFISGVSRAMSMVRFPGLAFVLSDFLYPFEQVESLFRELRAKNLDVCALQVLSHSEIDPDFASRDLLLVDSETGRELPLVMSESVRKEYLYRLHQHNLKLEDFFRSSGVRFLRSEAQQELHEFVQIHLAQSGLLT
ncbi:MAG: DUF58 domain-containing protein [Bdellovibrionales bacterium]|nr:DUF58 domain-containing protein [Bdellovibrionales bacterium]